MSNNINVIKTVVFVFLFLFSIKSNAQTTNGATVSGTLIDASNNQPLGFATVSLINKTTNQPKSMQTDMDGKFSFTGVSNGSYIFRAIYVGYLTYNRDTINITPK